MTQNKKQDAGTGIEERDEMPRHNYSDTQEDGDVEKSYHYFPGRGPKEQDSMGYTQGEMKIETCDNVLHGGHDLWIGVIYIGTIRAKDDVITPETGKANAQRIVECWNSHDRIKEEVKRLSDINRELVKLLTEADVWINKTSHDTIATQLKKKIKKHLTKQQ